MKSQDRKHPFHASVNMTGSASGGGSGQGSTLGDPDFVNIVPTDQYLDRYVFFTDFTYPETKLTVVRKKTPAGFLPVKLDCAGGGGHIDWHALDAVDGTGEYEFAWVQLTAGFAPQKVSPPPPAHAATAVTPPRAKAPSRSPSGDGAKTRATATQAGWARDRSTTRRYPPCSEQRGRALAHTRSMIVAMP